MVTIKPITVADLVHFKSTRLRALQDSPTAFGSTYARESQFADSDWQHRVAQWNSERSIAYLAWDGDKPCGIVAGAISDTAKAYLLSMWVAPTHRRRGIGKQLVNAIVQWTRQREILALYLDVTCNNAAAIRFYEELGFTKTGNTIPYPNDPALFEFQMSRATKF